MIMHVSCSTVIPSEPCEVYACHIGSCRNARENVELKKTLQDKTLVNVYEQAEGIEAGQEDEQE